MIPTADLEAAQALCEAAADGPWEARTTGSDSHVNDVDSCWVADVGLDSDSAAFIAASRSLVPALLDEVTALRAALREALEIAEDSAVYCVVGGPTETCDNPTCQRLAALAELAR